ncbi:MAG: hypothetical protein WKF59_08635 [Chitinophagaceae bacterium]
MKRLFYSSPYNERISSFSLFFVPIRLSASLALDVTERTDKSLINAIEKSDIAGT